MSLDSSLLKFVVCTLGTEVRIEGYLSHSILVSMHLFEVVYNIRALKSVNDLKSLTFHWLNTKVRTTNHLLLLSTG